MNLFHVTKKQPSGGLEIKTATGDIASFTTHYSEPLPPPFNGLNVKCTIEATGGGGTPATPIPIVGHSELNLVRCGKNFFEIDWFTDIGAERGTLTVSGESVTVTATSNDCYTNYVAARWPEDKRIKVKEGDVVRLRWERSGATGRCGIFANGSTNIGFKTEDNSTGLVTYTIPAGCDFITIRLGVANAGESVTYSNVMLTINDDTTAYAPYNCETFTVQFGQTVYGGVYDANRGKVTCTWAFVDVSAASVTTSRQVGNANEYRMFNIGHDTTNPDALCNIFEKSSEFSANKFNISTYGIYFRTDDTVPFTNEGGKQFLLDNNAQFIVKLATPIEIDVSELSVDTIVGTNNVFGDTGSVEVKYLDVV